MGLRWSKLWKTPDSLLAVHYGLRVLQVDLETIFHSLSSQQNPLNKTLRLLLSLYFLL